MRISVLLWPLGNHASSSISESETCRHAITFCRDELPCCAIPGAWVTVRVQPTHPTIHFRGDFSIMAITFGRSCGFGLSRLLEHVLVMQCKRTVYFGSLYSISCLALLLIFSTSTSSIIAGVTSRGSLAVRSRLRLTRILSSLTRLLICMKLLSPPAHPWLQTMTTSIAKFIQSGAIIDPSSTVTDTIWTLFVMSGHFTNN
jgi:hypothetical protein